MEYLDQFENLNLRLASRVEGASGRSPLVDTGAQNVARIIRAAGQAKQWEDLPTEDRRLVEKSEENR